MTQVQDPADGWSDEASGWRLESPQTGDTYEVTVTVAAQFMEHDGEAPRFGLTRILDKVVASVTYRGTLFTYTDTSVRWAVRNLVADMVVKGWRLWPLAPGERSRRELASRA